VKYMLEGIRLRRISLVDDPANQKAVVTLFKSAEGKKEELDEEEGETTPQEEAGVSNKEKSMKCMNCKSDVEKDSKFCSNCGKGFRPPNAGKPGKPSIPEKPAPKTKDDDDDDEDDKSRKSSKPKRSIKSRIRREVIRQLAEADGVEEEGDEGDAEDDVLKSLTPEARGLVENLVKRAKEAEDKANFASEAIAKMKDAEEERHWVQKSNFKHLSSKPAELGAVLKRVALGKSTKEDAEEIVRILTGANEAAKPSLRVIGKSGSGEAKNVGKTASEKLDILVNEAIEKSGGKKSYREAMDEVVRDNKDLWRQHTEETAARAVASGEEE